MGVALGQPDDFGSFVLSVGAGLDRDAGHLETLRRHCH
jgi:hypothetical protein